MKQKNNKISKNPCREFLKVPKIETKGKKNEHTLEIFKLYFSD
jgi:hypothetical protein